MKTNLTKGLERIGKGYFQAGYGRGFKKTSTVYLIDGKAWVRGEGYSTEKEGFLPVNYCTSFKKFHQLSPIEEHEYFKK